MRRDEQLLEHIRKELETKTQEVKNVITVAVFINGAPLVARSAVNQCKTDDDGKHEYLTDAGVTIFHDRDSDGGAIELAKLLLDTIDKRIC